MSKAQTILVITVAFFLTLAAATVGAQSGGMIVTPNEVKWPAAAAGTAGTSGVAGIQTVVLKGDPAKAGPIWKEPNPKRSFRRATGCLGGSGESLALVRRELSVATGRL